MYSFENLPSGVEAPKSWKLKLGSRSFLKTWREPTDKVIIGLLLTPHRSNRNHFLDPHWIQNPEFFLPQINRMSGLIKWRGSRWIIVGSGWAYYWEQQYSANNTQKSSRVKRKGKDVAESAGSAIVHNAQCAVVQLCSGWGGCSIVLYCPSIRDLKLEGARHGGFVDIREAGPLYKLITASRAPYMEPASL